MTELPVGALIHTTPNGSRVIALVLPAIAFANKGTVGNTVPAVALDPTTARKLAYTLIALAAELEAEG